MQQEFFGFDTIKELENLVEKYDAKNVFIVTGKKSFTLSGAEEEIKSILKDVKYTQFNSFSANPNIEEVRLGISLYKKISPDLVVGLGGGSVIDMAKMINVLAVQEEEPKRYITSEKMLKKPGAPLIAIPTTAGTGSEATHFATIYINKKKYSLDSQTLMLPTASIVDPKLTESTPKYLTASTGLDALCQGIESMWSVGSTEESRKYAKQSVEKALKTLEKVVNNHDKQSRLEMAKAAHLSGKAINISKTTACHSISYPITSYFNIPHGHAVALTMPHFIEFNSNVSKKDCNDKRGVDFVKKQINKIITLMDCKDAEDAKNMLQNMMIKLGVETRLNKLNIDQKGVELIINKGFTPDRMNNNPREVTRENLKDILDEIL